MNFKLPFWKLATALIVLTLICNPVLIELALLIDLVGLDVFLIVIELQFVAFIGYHFNMWVKPTLKIVYSTIQGNIGQARNYGHKTYSFSLNLNIGLQSTFKQRFNYQVSA
ncbi:MAG: hypothetical protein HRU25_18040 [Psychrobium sp.]|nr:hypothetical protein [Psychrobium sp.]